MPVSLAEAKMHMRVLHDAEDALIQMYIDSAGAYIANEIGQAIPEPAPADIKLAALLLVAHYYNHREAVITGSINSTLALAVDAHLAPYKLVTIV